MGKFSITRVITRNFAKISKCMVFVNIFALLLSIMLYCGLFEYNGGGGYVVLIILFSLMIANVLLSFYILIRYYKRISE
jgi:hypothetical protein